MAERKLARDRAQQTQSVIDGVVSVVGPRRGRGRRQPDPHRRRAAGAHRPPSATAPYTSDGSERRRRSPAHAAALKRVHLDEDVFFSLYGADTPGVLTSIMFALTLLGSGWSMTLMIPLFLVRRTRAAAACARGRARA